LFCKRTEWPFGMGTREAATFVYSFPFGADPRIIPFENDILSVLRSPANPYSSLHVLTFHQNLQIAMQFMFYSNRARNEMYSVNDAFGKAQRGEKNCRYLSLSPTYTHSLSLFLSRSLALSLSLSLSCSLSLFISF
jgi:hypothetical protein